MGRGRPCAREGSVVIPPPPHPRPYSKQTAEEVLQLTKWIVLRGGPCKRRGWVCVWQGLCTAVPGAVGSWEGLSGALTTLVSAWHHPG